MLDGLVDAVELAAPHHELGHRVGDAHAIVDDRALDQFAGGAPGHRVALGEGLARLRRAVPGLDCGRPLGTAELARERGVEGDVVARALARLDDDGVDPGRGDAHLARLQRATRQPLLHLHDHAPAAVARGQRDGLGVQVGGLVLEADVAVLVGGRGAHEGHVHPVGLVAQVLAAVDRDEFGQVVPGRRVHAPAAMTRVAHRAQAHVGDQPRRAGADGAKQLRGHAAGQDVGLDPVVLRELLHARAPDPVAADHAPHQPLVGEAVHAARALVADAQRVHRRQRAGAPGGQEAALHGLEQLGGLHQAATAAHQRHGGAVGDQRRRGVGAQEPGPHRRPLPPQRARSNSAAPFFSTLRAITPRWISEVPS